MTKIPLILGLLALIVSCSPYRPGNNNGNGGNPGTSAGDFYVSVRMETLPAPAAASFQFEITYDPLQMKPDTGTFYELTSEAQSASKTLQCNLQLTPDTVRCILYGLNQNILPNAPMARLHFLLNDSTLSQVNFQVKNAVISDPNGSQIPIPTQGSVVSYKTQSQAMMKTVGCRFEADVEVRLMAFQANTGAVGKTIIGLPECRPIKN